LREGGRARKEEGPSARVRSRTLECRPMKGEKGERVKRLLEEKKKWADRAHDAIGRGIEKKKKRGCGAAEGKKKGSRCLLRD